MVLPNKGAGRWTQGQSTVVECWLGEVLTLVAASVSLPFEAVVAAEINKKNTINTSIPK